MKWNMSALSKLQLSVCVCVCVCVCVWWVTHLHVIRNEDGATEAASNATDHVDETDSQPAEQLLQVTHEQQLKNDAQQQLNNSTRTHSLVWTAAETRCSAAAEQSYKNTFTRMNSSWNAMLSRSWTSLQEHIHLHLTTPYLHLNDTQ